MLKKGDFVVFGIIVSLSLILFFAFFGKGGKQVTVTSNGKPLGEYPLNRHQVVPIVSENGVNTLIIENGEAYFKNSDCPDKTCERTGKIKNVGETIVCLPHKVIAEVTE